MTQKRGKGTIILHFCLKKKKQQMILLCPSMKAQTKTLMNIYVCFALHALEAVLMSANRA